LGPRPGRRQAVPLRRVLAATSSREPGVLTCARLATAARQVTPEDSAHGTSTAGSCELSSGSPNKDQHVRESAAKSVGDCCTLWSPPATQKGWQSSNEPSGSNFFVDSAPAHASTCQVCKLYSTQTSHRSAGGWGILLSANPSADWAPPLPFLIV
jgi:hypothetical protein